MVSIHLVINRSRLQMAFESEPSFVVFLEDDPREILHGVDHIGEIRDIGVPDQNFARVIKTGEIKIEKMEKSCYGTSDILPEKLLRINPLVEYLLLEKHTGCEQQTEKERLEKDCNTYPVKTVHDDAIGIEGGNGNTGYEKQELDRCKNDLDISPDRSVPLGKLFRCITGHRLLLLCDGKNLAKDPGAVDNTTVRGQTMKLGI
jgi:hypothetical protein